MAELAAHAKRLGVSPERYARELIEKGLEIGREARTKTFDEILEPVRATAAAMKDKELDKLVDQARTRHHRAVKSKRRRA